MTRDIEDRLDMFGEHCVDVHRLALNMDQVDDYNPPPNPAKLSDSRAADYVMNFGRTSWELDALEPNVITDLIDDEVNGLIDTALWNRTLQQEKEGRESLSQLRDRWPEIKEWMNGQ